MSKAYAARRRGGERRCRRKPSAARAMNLCICPLAAPGLHPLDPVLTYGELERRLTQTNQRPDHELLRTAARARVARVKPPAAALCVCGMFGPKGRYRRQRIAGQSIVDMLAGRSFDMPNWQLSSYNTARLCSDACSSIPGLDPRPWRPLLEAILEVWQRRILPSPCVHSFGLKVTGDPGPDQANQGIRDDDTPPTQRRTGCFLERRPCSSDLRCDRGGSHAAISRKSASSLLLPP